MIALLGYVLIAGLAIFLVWALMGKAEPSERDKWENPR